MRNDHGVVANTVFDLRVRVGGQEEGALQTGMKRQRGRCRAGRPSAANGAECGSEPAAEEGGRIHQMHSYKLV